MKELWIKTNTNISNGQKSLTLPKKKLPKCITNSSNLKIKITGYR